MFFGDRISIPLRRQYHEQKGGLFSLCQRKYIKWRYIFCNKASNAIGTVVWSIIGVFIMIFLFSSHLKQNVFINTGPLSVHKNYISDNRIQPNNSTKSRVYKTIQNWQLSAFSDVNMLPKLSSLRNPEWLRYPNNELFTWNEKPFNFVHERLKELDIENQKEFGYYSATNSKYGDLGKPVVLKGHLREEAAAKFSIHQIDVVASNVMSLNRRLQEVRESKCLNKQYPDRLQSASVIVIFHNEARSTILRTVHSVINRSPTSLLKEVILVDDASKHDELLSSLDKYVTKLPLPVRIIRLNQRQGLIRARIAGANQATGQVLIFLDSHIEVANGWLEPILSEISSDRTRVILPVVDNVDFQTMGYIDWDVGVRTRGGLDWNFLWTFIEPDIRFENTSGYDETDPFPSPTMVGCAFAIDREFFYKSGSYDKNMMIWGGENIEMAIRVWLCGGSLITLPCSHIGHIFRQYSPYTSMLDREDHATANTNRLVEVWMDKYKSFYYYLKKGAKYMETTDLKEREILRDNLQCLNFQWYLDNVYPSAPFPNQHHYLGPVRQPYSGLCLTSKGTREGLSGMNICHGLGALQVILLTRNMELQNGVLCLEPIHDKKSKLAKASFMPCNFSPEQKWDFLKITESGERGQIVHQTSGKCLSFSKVKERTEDTRYNKVKMLSFLSNIVNEIGLAIATPALEPCEQNTASNRYQAQIWSIDSPANFSSDL